MSICYAYSGSAGFYPGPDFALEGKPTWVFGEVGGRGTIFFFFFLGGGGGGGVEVGTL